MDRLDISALNFDGLVGHEWLETNGIGGYAASTLCGLNTRKYHGLLIAAMTPPVRRMVLLSHVDESVTAGETAAALSCNEYPGTIFPHGHQLLRAFSADPFPRWAYQADSFTLEKSVRLLRGENTVCLSYTLLGGTKSVHLEIRPKLALRPIHELMYQWNGRLGAENKSQHLVRIPPTSRTPEVFFAHDGEFEAEPFWYLNTIYRREQERGYAGLEDLWMPGTFRWLLSPGQTVHLVCSTEPVELDRIVSDLDRHALAMALPVPTDGLDVHYDALVRAADAFVVTTPQDTDQVKPVYVVSQYPWSTPSGRAALVGFAGLFMVPGRFNEGRRLLLTLVEGLKNGLIPTEYPESGETPRYQGADTSLWLINAAYDYWRYTGDEATLGQLLPKLEFIIDAYRHGAGLGIAADGDGLIASRSAGTPTSWMDAKVAEWVITPRQGRPVELNALWYNALKIVANFSARFGHPQADELATFAETVKASFNRRFWNADLNCCFDVVDDHGNEASIRPNQLLAISLPHAVLNSDRHRAVIQTVVRELLTIAGVRTLSRRDTAYQGHYQGNVLARDRAQHQGAVYPWLLGPMITAFLKVNGRSEAAISQAKGWLDGCLKHLHQQGVGQLCELFDGDQPHRPDGAPASAISVGEVLRCYAQDILGLQPNLIRAQSSGQAVAPAADSVAGSQSR